MLKVVDSHPHVPPIVYFLNNFVRCDEILGWLITHRLTGSQLLEFTQKAWGNQLLSMTKHILTQINKDTEVKPVYVGKDVIANQ
jgi:hypothetical protein